MESTLETIEPYIVDELPILNVTDLTNAYIGFTHSDAGQRFEILDLIETKLVNLTFDKKISLEESIEILFEMSQKQIGSKVLIENLFAQVEAQAGVIYK